MGLNRFNKILIICVLLTVALLVPAQASAQESTAVNTDDNVSSVNRGPYFDIIMSAALLPGAIQNELMGRGLVSINFDEQGKAASGRVDVDAIAQLIDQGVYWVDQQKHLRADPRRESEVFTITAGYYRYAQMVTRTLGMFDNYNYRGDICYVTVPSNITLGAGTTHNLYSTHLCQGDTSHWIEAGIVWANWLPDNGPAVFTYDTYGNGWKYTVIPAGVQREVYLNIEIYSDYSADMYARDSYSDISKYTQCQVSTLNSRADEVQEQHSYSYTYTATSQVLLDRSRLKNTNNQWVNWNDSINTAWTHETPLYENHGISNDMKWIQTWCSP